MQIANPLYDTVFKYLLDDEPVAELFLSALLGKAVKIVGYNSPEMLRNREQSETNEAISKQKELPFYSVLRLDFSAQVQHADGSLEIILIEVQKASNATDLMRFRRYLGLQLQSKQNAIKDKNGILQPLTVYPIYFLGEGLPNIKGHGAVKVERTCYDAFTGERLDIKDNFIEKLTHDALIICANELRGEQATGLQKLLSIFNLAAQFKYAHFLIIEEDDYPAEYRPIIRRLQKAAEMAEVRRYMDDEDDYLTQLVSAERGREEATALANVLQQQNKEILIQIKEEKKKAAKEKQEKEKAEKEKEKAEKEKEKAEKEKEKAWTKSILFGIKNGFSDAEIADNFDISIEVVARIRSIL
jgi:hypothetical protein